MVGTIKCKRLSEISAIFILIIYNTCNRIKHKNRIIDYVIDNNINTHIRDDRVSRGNSLLIHFSNASSVYFCLYYCIISNDELIDSSLSIFHVTLTSCAELTSMKALMVQ